MFSCRLRFRNLDVFINMWYTQHDVHSRVQALPAAHMQSLPAPMCDAWAEDCSVFSHAGPQCVIGDALLRALSGSTRAPASSAGSVLVASQAQASQCAAALMASAVHPPRAMKRHYDLLTTKEDIGRQYAVARRLAAGQKGYLSEWAKAT